MKPVLPRTCPELSPLVVLKINVAPKKALPLCVGAQAQGPSFRSGGTHALPNHRKRAAKTGWDHTTGGGMGMPMGWFDGLVKATSPPIGHPHGPGREGRPLGRSAQHHLHVHLSCRGARGLLFLVKHTDPMGEWNIHKSSICIRCWFRHHLRMLLFFEHGSLSDPGGRTVVAATDNGAPMQCERQ